ncbi:MAG: ferrochelatase [Alphaproteobacteria bacterium]|nr:ferrochelatase [Alphaproteobacteria bacterium]
MIERTAVERAASADAAGARVGVVVVNLGTPDSADAAGLRVYLREFLSDPRVVENQGLMWQLVLNGIILRRRPQIRARDYQKIWNRELNESPLKTVTRAQASKLADRLSPHAHVVVDWAMRYGNPSLRATIEALVARGCERIVIAPLYPQYSAATTASVGDEVFRVLSRLRAQPALRIVPPYWRDKVYIEAVAASIEAELARLEFEPEVIVASFHGMPASTVELGDPYLDHCTATVNALRQRLGRDSATLRLAFQSRFGRGEWLQPYLDAMVERLAKDGVRRLAVVAPGFASDCLETLEEIALHNSGIFLKSGGERFVTIPCLNDSTGGIKVIHSVVLRELQGWI